MGLISIVSSRTYRFPKMTVISKIHARQIYDSRGNPTVECEVSTPKGTFRAAVPSGASTGIYEALELRDKDKAHWLGKGCETACKNVNTTINDLFAGKDIDICDQRAVDKVMLDCDVTPNKSKLGANAILGVSLAIARAAAAEQGLPLYQHLANLAGNTDRVILPVPAFNVINGGSHAGNKLAMQEFMILPYGVESFSAAMKAGAEIYQNLKLVIKKKYGQDAVNVGDEGGFAPNILANNDALDLVTEAIEVAGYTGKVGICMDVAASEFWNDEKKRYDLDFKSDNSDMPESERFLTPIQLVGDDLLVTNPSRIQTALDKKACNALLLKVNQIGSLTEAIDACNMAQKSGWGVMVSHRSG